MQSDTLARAILETLQSPNEEDSNGEAANVVDGLFAIASAVDRLAAATERLGTNGASGPMGAVEAVAKEIRDGFEAVSGAVAEAGQWRGS